MNEEPEQEKKSGQEPGSQENGPLPPKKNGSPGDALPPEGTFVHRHVLLLIWLGALALMLVGAVLWVVRYVEGPGFHERARRYAVEQMERAIGGRVELESVSWSLPRLEFELSGLQIHGTEAAGEAPLLRVERARARLKWSELLAGHLAMRELQVLHPLAHVDVYKDGSTNFPGVKAQKPPLNNQTEQLLRLAVDQAELVDGRLDWNQQKIRLDGVATGIFAELGYHAADASYQGVARVGQVRVRMPQWEPLILGGEAEFRLYHDRVEVPRLRVSAGRTWVEASGAVSGLASPVAQFSYRAAGDAAELARLVHYRELKSGAVQLSGQGTYRWERGDYAVTGKAQAAGVTYADSIVRLEKMNGGFFYTLNPEHFNVSSIFATALGGTVHGKMDTSFLRGREAEGRIELEVTGVELQQALRAFSSSDLPLERLPLAGSTVGTLGVTWRGSPLNAFMDGDLRVQPLARAGQLPVSAVVQATVDFRSGAVQVHNLDASTNPGAASGGQGTHLSAQGRLSAISDLKLDATTANFAELEPLVASWRGTRAQDMPIEFGGRASFRGTVQGKLQSPSLAGSLELHDFVTVVRIPSQAKTGAAVRVVRSHWDLLQGEVQYSASGESLHNGLLRHGATTLGVDASVGLVNGSYDSTLPFAARLKLENAGLDELQAMAGSGYPVSGQVSGELQVSGTAHHLNGQGRVAIKDGTAWQQTVSLATAELNLAENQAQFRNIVVKSDAMQLSGDARYNLESREFGFDVRGSEVKLERLRALSQKGMLRVNGQAAFEAIGEGTASAPVINGHLSLLNLAVNRQAIGNVNVQAETHGEDMKLTARSDFKSAEVKLDGEIHLRGQMPVHLTGDLHSTELNSLITGYLPVRLTGPSEVKAHLDATGEALNPRNMTADLVIDRLATSYGGISVANDGAIRLRMEHQIVKVQQLRLSGEQGARFVQVRGEIQLGGKREIDLRAQGSVNLKLLETANPDLMAGGVANLNVQVNGTLKRPSMHGQLNVQGASITSIDFPNGLSDITGSLVFNEDRLQLQELTARTGGGLLHCTGFITYSPAQGLGFNLSADGREIRLRYPEGLSSTADASLTLSGTPKNALLSGNVTVTRLGVNPRFDFASYLVKGMRGAPAQKIDSPLNAVHMDVHVTSTAELQVQTSLARLSGNVDLRLRGSAARPVVLGRVNLLEGTLEFNGTKYRMERGDVTFTNPVRIEPTLDVELSARVRDYDITLGFHGPVNKLTPSYRSDPPLSSSDIISLLALGSTAEEQANPAMMGTSQYQPTVSESASSALLGQALSATVGSRVQRLFGVSRVKIDPNVGGAVNTGLARVTVEQQVSNKLTLTYITNLNQSAQEIIEFEYNVNKDVSVVGVRDQTGVVSVDVVLRRRKK
jgi:translocation and assembly module TamB